MTHPTAPDTGAIRQRLEKITPGPWEAEWTPMGKGYTRIIGGIDGDAYDDGSPRTISTHVCDVIDNADEEANLDFIAHAPADIAALLAEVERLEGRVKFFKDACVKMNHEVCQSLGKALGYPWFKDDQKNFPGATEADGICEGDEVAESLAETAAREIIRLRSLAKEGDTP